MSYTSYTRADISKRNLAAQLLSAEISEFLRELTREKLRINRIAALGYQNTIRSFSLKEGIYTASRETMNGAREYSYTQPHTHTD